MSDLDDLLERHRVAGPPSDRELPPQPSKRVAVVTCMDSRINPFDLFGLRNGEAHVIRNAGGLVTEQELRSLTVSQRKLGTRTIIVMTHVGCGMATFDDGDFLHELRADTGHDPAWTPGSFADPAESVRESIRRLRDYEFLPHRDDVHGLVLEIETGRLFAVEPTRGLPNWSDRT